MVVICLVVGMGLGKLFGVSSWIIVLGIPAGIIISIFWLTKGNFFERLLFASSPIALGYILSIAIPPKGDGTDAYQGILLVILGISSVAGLCIAIVSFGIHSLYRKMHPPDPDQF